MREETFEYLRQAADAGTWGLSSIDLSADPIHPEAESDVTITWRIQRMDFGDGLQAGDGILTIYNDGNEQRAIVPPVGRHLIRVGASPVHVAVQMQGERGVSKVLILQPRIIIPEIHLQPPARIVVGDVATLSWEARHAVRGHLIVRNGENLIFQGEVPPQGRMEIVARDLSPVNVQMRAWSRHEHISDSAVAVSETVIQVLPPPVRIEITDGEQTKRGFIGNEVTFGWRITGAKEAFLRAVERGEVVSAPLSGSLGVEVLDPEEEVFQLIAIGLDGSELVKELKVIPILADVSTISPDLHYLNVAWEG